MKINKALITRLRESKPWSQGELAQAAGLGLRTVQRAERDGNVSLETKKALASALDVDVRAIEGEAQDWPPKVVQQLLDMQQSGKPPPSELLGKWEGDFYGHRLTLDITEKMITPGGPIYGASPYSFRNDMIAFGLNGRIQTRKVEIISDNKMSFTNFENDVTVEFSRIA